MTKNFVSWYQLKWHFVLDCLEDRSKLSITFRDSQAAEVMLFAFQQVITDIQIDANIQMQIYKY